MSNRREFLLRAGAAAATQALGYSLHLHAEAGVASDLTLEEDPSAPKIPHTYTGLSYELSQLSDPGFFIESNHDLVAYFRLLSAHGILRLGGNTSEFCWFRANSSTPEPRLHVPRHPEENWMPHQLFAITPEAIDALAGFLRATGWRLIYGLNFGNSTPPRAAEEAAYVAKAVGDRLEYFQIGNEPDLYTKASNGTRPPGWSFDDYVREWIAYADAVSAKVPDARFGGPDVAASSDWVVRFGEQMAPRLGARLAALTGHYYAEGPPDDPRVTIERLLAPNPKIATDLRRIEATAGPNGPVYRMTEGNSCYRGGKPGMSDAFAAALWAADYMLELASLGCAGVNLHGGASAFLTAGLGGHTPGADSASKAQQVRSGYYSPIRTEPGIETRAMPVFYGMKLAGMLAGGAFLRTHCDLHGVNAGVYATTRERTSTIAIINKDESRNLEFNLRIPRGKTAASITRLQAPRLDATENVTLGGTQIEPHADWRPSVPEKLPINNGKALIRVPAASAAEVLLS
jgi:Glycosyl hydrolase family 79 C-terminal beta domain